MIAAPSISVVMPVWNGETYLREAIESILSQTFNDFEFIIIDDGSTDNSPEIISQFADKDSRIRVIRIEHEGIVVALNRGVDEARAIWIARMDCDDIAKSTRLETQWMAIQKKSGVVLCHTHIYLIGDAKLIKPPGKFIRTKSLLALRLCFQCPIIHPTVMFHKPTFIRCGGYYPEERHAEDYGLWGRLLMEGDVIGIPEQLLYLRVHSESISHVKSDIQRLITTKTAILNCAWFLKLDESQATEAYQIISNKSENNSLTAWCFFVMLRIPHLRWKSLEMFAWLAVRTKQLLIFHFNKRRASHD